MYEKGEHRHITIKGQGQPSFGRVFEDFRKALDACEADRSFAQSTLTGSGYKIFSAGATFQPASATTAPWIPQRGHDLCKKIEDFPAPVIARDRPCLRRRL